MVKQGFYVGRRKWYVMVYYDVATADDLREVEETLFAAACPSKTVAEAMSVLSDDNSGMTFTNFADHLSVVFISRATSPEQMYDTIQHELRHVTSHVCEYYGVDPAGERSAYLQGEIGRQMFPAASIVVCPRCKK